QKPLLNTWSTPLLHETTLYTGAEDGYVYAIDIETGDTQWRFQTKRRIRSSPVISDSLLFIGSDDNHLYALHVETGRLVWSFETGGSI
ncbi:MAG: PQQ-binding-like beta-propeller repeat protein, partial [Candidatus Latescibacteria bacterium]|nr:PQQ-binding-like beta-propeller repeat protein [Candidatus Latescibacterota bacterium]